jgi:hypothetical protein
MVIYFSGYFCYSVGVYCSVFMYLFRSGRVRAKDIKPVLRVSNGVENLLIGTDRQT